MERSFKNLASGDTSQRRACPTSWLWIGQGRKSDAGLRYSEHSLLWARKSPSLPRSIKQTVHQNGHNQTSMFSAGYFGISSLTFNTSPPCLVPFVSVSKKCEWLSKAIGSGGVRRALKRHSRQQIVFFHRVIRPLSRRLKWTKPPRLQRQTIRISINRHYQHVDGAEGI